jgi:hypothetical protein
VWEAAFPTQNEQTLTIAPRIAKKAGDCRPGGRRPRGFLLAYDARANHESGGSTVPGDPAGV